ncbi:hypothetical protein G7Z17_g3205 [Cylindrodendrum hubeiense]|uniref:Uncharacterized protein n=1 Tax=Cylindrodendrum hubeiense TaxID=595255 RepID=A0A9P5LJK1_9HYPO|nr:hypothetical protein G7Z17_g3205 [Cylindrodendrum hubeiense]
MVDRKRIATRASSRRGAAGAAPTGPNVYQDMLAEAGVNAQDHSPPERPLKRRRAGPSREEKPPEKKIPEQETLPSSSRAVQGDQATEANEDDSEDEDIEFEDVVLPEPIMQTMELESEDEDEDDVIFEDVDFGVLPKEIPAAQEPKELVLNLTAQQSTTAQTKKAAERRKPLTKEERERRADYDPPSDMESCLDRDDFREAANKLQGSRDVGAQLYCALLRSVGVQARLVCSLQPLACVSGAPTLPKPKPVKPSSKVLKNEQVQATMAKYQEMANAGYGSPSSGSTARRRLGHPNATAYNFEPKVNPPKPRPTFDVPKKIKESSYPVYWVEILDVGHQKWQPVDPVVTHTFWKPKGLEPPITDKENSMSYVVAFEADGTARDVTKRYAKAYTAKTRKLRVDSTTEGGDLWWQKVMKMYRRRRPTDLDQIEDNELAGVEAREPMPRNVQDFKDHPIYALERHLRRNEVLVPSATPSGTVGAGSRGPLERIYRRKDVRIARSADKWYRMGREVKPNEIPAKWLPKKARPKGSRFDEEEEDEAQGDAGTPVYTEDQTELYVPPRVRNGRVPKNKFGNIDVYVPSMVPAGVLHGIVVAKEYEEALWAVIQGLGDLEQQVEDERRRNRALRAWRKFLMGLRIREQIWSGVDAEERREADDKAAREAHLDDELDDAPSDVTEEFNMFDDDDDGGGGGFLID